MSNSYQTLADKLKAIKDRAEFDQIYRGLLLASPKNFLEKEGIDFQNIEDVKAEFHLNYGICILIKEKVATSFSPAPTSKHKDNYDFLDCHNF